MARKRVVVFTPTPKRYRVKCDLEFSDPMVALALRRILDSFQTSVQRMEAKSGTVEAKR